MTHKVTQQMSTQKGLHRGPGRKLTFWFCQSCAFEVTCGSMSNGICRMAQGYLIGARRMGRTPLSGLLSSALGWLLLSSPARAIFQTDIVPGRYVFGGSVSYRVSEPPGKEDIGRNARSHISFSWAAQPSTRFGVKCDLLVRSAAPPIMSCKVVLVRYLLSPLIVHGEYDFVASTNLFLASANQNWCDNFNCYNNMNWYHEYSFRRNKWNWHSENSGLLRLTDLWRQQIHFLRDPGATGNLSAVALVIQWSLTGFQ